MVKMGTSSYMSNNSMTLVLDFTFVKTPISLIVEIGKSNLFFLFHVSLHFVLPFWSSLLTCIFLGMVAKLLNCTWQNFSSCLWGAI